MTKQLKLNAKTNSKFKQKKHPTHKTIQKRNTKQYYININVYKLIMLFIY